MRRPSIICLALPFTLLACDGSGDPTEPPAAPPKVEIVSGNWQSALIGEDLNAPLVVRYVDASGRAIADAPVVWTNHAGNGSLHDASTLTNADGMARASWTLGPRVAIHAVSASVDGRPPVLFGATPLAGEPAVIEHHAGNGQSAVATTVLPDTLVVRVLDDRGYPVPDAPVVWSGDGAFLWYDTTRTDRDGYARTRWRLGSAFGAQQATATLGEMEASFSATARSDGAVFGLSSLVTGENHACGLNEQQRAVCWSLDDPHSASVVAGDVAFRTLSAGDSVTCGIALDARAWCWGSNRYGGLGNGATASSDVPVPVAVDRTFTHIEVGRWTVCGLSTLADVWCWGDGVTSTPMRLATDSFDVAHVTVAYSFIYLLEENGAVRSHMLSSSFNMAQSRVDPGFVALEANYGLVCGTTAAGALWCGEEQQIPEFVQVAVDPDEVQRVMSFYYSCALNADGVTRCFWSDNPAVIVDVPPLRALSSDNPQCGLAVNGATYCWDRGEEATPSLVRSSGS